MFKENKITRPYFISLALHILLMFILMGIHFEIEPEPDDIITLGFGNVGKISSAGNLGQITEEFDKTVKSVITEEEVTEKKEDVELPKTVNYDEDNISTTPLDEEEKKDEKVKDIKPAVTEEDQQGESETDKSNGLGNYGFEIDFGGQGLRNIYSYSLPEYPSGVTKEIDLKLKFTILPDGTVGRIFPLIKADTKLELAAIQSLRKWRFEPLPPGKKYEEQSAVIIFPYRLK